jgi:hypothetical protein
VGPLGAQPTAGQTSNRAFDVDGTDVSFSGCVVFTIDKCSSQRKQAEPEADRVTPRLGATCTQIPKMYLNTEVTY